MKDKSFFIKATLKSGNATWSTNYLIREQNLRTKEGIDKCIEWLMETTGAKKVNIDFIWELKG